MSLNIEHSVDIVLLIPAEAPNLPIIRTTTCFTTKGTNHLVSKHSPLNPIPMGKHFFQGVSDYQ